VTSASSWFIEGPWDAWWSLGLNEIPICYIEQFARFLIQLLNNLARVQVIKDDIAITLPSEDVYFIVD
jgi:hypothetical protein